MSKVVSLSVHKNTRDQRARKIRRQQLVGVAKEIARDFSPDGYAIIAYRHGDGETSFDVRYSCRDGFEVHALPGVARSALDAKIAADINGG